jgi:hypothetical protein
MGIAGHNQRLKRLETSRGAAESGRLVFFLYDWADGAPIGFNSEEEEEALFPRFQAAALDNLVAKGKIRECDRSRVQFIVWVSAKPSRPEQLEPFSQQEDCPR